MNSGSAGYACRVDNWDLIEMDDNKNLTNLFTIESVNNTWQVRNL
jgi:hypothetical protein